MLFQASAEAAHTSIELFAIFELKLLHRWHYPKNYLLAAIGRDINWNALLSLIITHLHFDELAAVVARIDHVIEDIRINGLLMRIALYGQAWFPRRAVMHLCSGDLGTVQYRRLLGRTHTGAS